MKKTVSLLLVLILVLALVACGGGNDAAADGLKAGTYTGEGEGGHGGPVKVEVVVGDDGKISAVNVLEHNETEGIGSLALESLPGAVVENNGTEGVDAVSGASMTSEAFFSAVNAALEQAK